MGTAEYRDRPLRSFQRKLGCCFPRYLDVASGESADDGAPRAGEPEEGASGADGRSTADGATCSSGVRSPTIFRSRSRKRGNADQGVERPAAEPPGGELPRAHGSEGRERPEIKTRGECCVEREAEQIDRHGQSRAVGGELATRKFSSGFRGIAGKCDASGARLWAVGAEEEVEAKQGAGGARCAERQKRTRDAGLETVARAWRHALRRVCQATCEGRREGRKRRSGWRGRTAMGCAGKKGGSACRRTSSRWSGCGDNWRSSRTQRAKKAAQVSSIHCSSNA